MSNINLSRWKSNYNPQDEAIESDPKIEVPKDSEPEVTDPNEGEATPLENDNSATQTEETKTGGDKDQPDHNWEKRAKDQQRFISELQNKIKSIESETQKQVSTLQEQLKKNQMSGLPKTPEELEEFRKEHPEVSAVIDTMIKTEAQRVSEDVDSKLKQTKEAQENLNRERQLDIIERRGHPDIRELLGTQLADIQDWLTYQRPAVKAMWDSSDIDDLIEGVSRYKADKGISLESDISKKQDLKKAKEEASMVPTKVSTPNTEPKDSKPIWSESQVERLSDKDYEKYSKEIQESVREGTFIYDKSKF